MDASRVTLTSGVHLDLQAVTVSELQRIYGAVVAEVKARHAAHLAAVGGNQIATTDAAEPARARPSGGTG